MVFEGVVEDIRLAAREGIESVWWMSLGPAEFRPGDRGTLEAETRSGTRLAIPVTSVVTDAHGMVWCVVDKPLAAGTEVLARVQR
jgi:hypothetical protein